MAETQVEKTKVEIPYKCECCGEQFVSHRTRQGEKLCSTCAELRRTLKSFTNKGLSEAEVLKRGRQLLGVKK